MPWKVFVQDGEHCVFKIDADEKRIGKTLGCHPSESAANKQLAALHASEEVENEQMEKGLPATSEHYSTGPSQSHSLTREEMEEAKKSVEAAEMADVAIDYVPLGPTTFADLHAAHEAMEAGQEVHNLTYQFQSLVFNIMSDQETDNKLGAIRALSAEFIVLVEDALGGAVEESADAAAEKAEEAALAESDVGSVIALYESQEVEDDKPRPLELDVVVIEPGWGNENDNHFYSAEMLLEYAAMFNGAKMYASDHRAHEKSVLTEVSQVLECPVLFTETGAPVARVGVFDDRFAESIRNRAELGKLDGLHVSILADGTARPFELDGRKGKIVETIAEGASVDWVTRAGAGGRALRLAETDESVKETDMPEETNIPAEEELEAPAEVQSDEKVEAAETVVPAEPVTLTESEVQEVLDESKLPDISRDRLKVTEYADADALGEAITAEREYVVALTGSGRPVGQAAKDPPQKTGMSEDEYSADMDEIDKRYNVYREIAK